MPPRRPPRRRGRRSGRPLGPGPRPLRPGMRRAAWPPPPPELEAARGDVARAHELMADGSYEAAAELFVRVAALAAGHQHFRRAGQLYAQAAHAAVEGTNLTLAMGHADKAIGALIQAKEYPHAVHLVDRMAEALQSREYVTEAQLLRNKLNARLAEAGVDADQVRARAAGARPSRGTLPAQCEACLGPVRSDEVEWIDDTSAVCAYCGSILKAT